MSLQGTIFRWWSELRRDTARDLLYSESESESEPSLLEMSRKVRTSKHNGRRPAHLHHGKRLDALEDQGIDAGYEVF